MAYQSTNPLFRSLTDEEEENFRAYARRNPMPDGDTQLYHPVCIDEWNRQRDTFELPGTPTADADEAFSGKRRAGGAQ